ncbi:hypothetical protein GQX74_000109 [Glossina fuscipes]|nr:hypothetical protein GQX74_000109 [Glossina fuscipes]
MFLAIGLGKLSKIVPEDEITRYDTRNEELKAVAAVPDLYPTLVELNGIPGILEILSHPSLMQQWRISIFLNNIHVFSALTELESKADSFQLIDYQPTLRKVGKSITSNDFKKSFDTSDDDDLGPEQNLPLIVLLLLLVHRRDFHINLAYE